MLEARRNQGENSKRSPKDPQPCTSAGNKEKGGLRHREPPRLGRAERAQITEAFRRYAAHGQNPNYGEMLGTDTWLSDTAVSQTLSVLRAEGKDYIAAAVVAVYFVDPTKPLKKNDIEYRVTAFCVNSYASRATVYRWLSVARTIYWAIAHHND